MHTLIDNSQPIIHTEYITINLQKSIMINDDPKVPPVSINNFLRQGFTDLNSLC